MLFLFEFGGGVGCEARRREEEGAVSAGLPLVRQGVRRLPCRAGPGGPAAGHVPRPLPCVPPVSAACLDVVLVVARSAGGRGGGPT